MPLLTVHKEFFLCRIHAPKIVVVSAPPLSKILITGHMVFLFGFSQQLRA